jgi:hypothetical protein
MTVRDVTLQITLKRGFSPEEQYRANGRQGAWTDVYSVAATLYQCLTGLKPPDALERLDSDTLQPPSQIGIKIPRKSEDSLMKALAVRAADRFQTMEEFQRAFQPVDPGHSWFERLKLAISAAWDWARPRRRLLVYTAGVAVLAWVLLRVAASLFIVPEIREFAVEPETVPRGQPATMRWSATGGKLTIAPDIGRIISIAGVRTVVPNGTTTYTLTASGPLRSVSRSAKLTVGPPPNPIAATFTAEPLTIKKGGSAELVWSFSGEPKTVTIDHGIGAVANRGRLKVSPAADTTYVITAQDPDGQTVQSAVTVMLERSVPKPVIVSLTANPTSVRKGQSAVLSWEVTGDNVMAIIDHNVGRVKLRDTATVLPAATTTYRLQAGNGGGAVSRSVVVEVDQPTAPTIRTFTVSPDSVAVGHPATLSWSVAGEVQSVDITPGLQSVPAAGSRSVAPSSTTTYTIYASGPGGAVTGEVTVRVAAPAPPVIRTFRASAGLIGLREPVTLEWSITGDVSTATLDPGGISVPLEGSRRVAPDTTTRYILRVIGPGGSRASAVDVQVSKEPFKILLFEAKPSKIKRGAAATLSWAASGPVTDVSIEPGIGKLPAAAGSIEVKPDQDTNYILTVKAGNRFLISTVKVSVRR